MSISHTISLIPLILFAASWHSYIPSQLSWALFFSGALLGYAVVSFLVSAWWQYMDR